MFPESYSAESWSWQVKMQSPSLIPELPNQVIYLWNQHYLHAQLEFETDILVFKYTT